MALTCPFCGSPETDRFALEGRQFLVFRCMFTPSYDPALDEAGIAAYLTASFTRGGAKAYFQGMCDKAHLFVTQGPGGAGSASSD